MTIPNPCDNCDTCPTYPKNCTSYYSCTRYKDFICDFWAALNRYAKAHGIEPDTPPEGWNDDLPPGCEAITSARKAAGITQLALANMIGVASSTVSQWELGRCIPTPANVYRLSKALHIPMDKLVF